MGVFMYKRFSIFVSSIICLGVLATLLSIYTINNTNQKSYVANFSEIKSSVLQQSLQEIKENQTLVIETHAYWDEVIDAINRQDTPWLEINATKYILDDDLFGLDYILVTNEEQSYVSEAGGQFSKELLKHPLVEDSLNSNSKHLFLKKINKEIAIVSVSPLAGNNRTNPTGLYLCISFLNFDYMNDLSELLGHELTSLTVGAKSDLDSINIKKEILVQEQILDSDFYLIAKFNNKDMYNIFYLQRNYITWVVILSASLVAISIIFFLRTIILKIKSMTALVLDISKGKYSKDIEIGKNNLLEELSDLALAVNSMSADIRDHASAIEKNYNDIVEVIINSVEINDAYTSNHNIVVGEYAKVIARAIHYTDIDTIELAAKLHDIGKISIPSHILNKAGQLTPEEYELIKTHSNEGYKIIKDIEFFDEIKLGVKHHHEKWDGTGYPDNLSGQDIPLIAQIIAISDVYDAITSDRSYRKAQSHDLAYNIILRGSGSHFNPILVDAFIKSVAQFDKIRLNNLRRE